MTDIQVFDISPALWLDGQRWWVGSQLARALGAREASDVVNRVSADQKRRHPVNTRGGQQVMWIVGEAGVRTILGRSRSPKAKDLAEHLRIGMVWAAPVEADCMRVIAAAVGHLNPRPQYGVGPYRIDLYVAALNVAVECDEIGHADKCATKDAEREAAIVARLGCRFVRFDPQQPAFNVGHVVRAVIDPEFQPWRSQSQHRRHARPARCLQEAGFMQARFEIEGMPSWPEPIEAQPPTRPPLHP